MEIMYCILITNKWTNSRQLYPFIYDSETEANKAIKSLPFSSKNNKFDVKELVKVGWALNSTE